MFGTVEDMTTMTNPLPTPPPPAAPPGIRRSDTNRVVAGVCGGLGEYFQVDPVLFRVLFGVSAFFGGFGILAYLVAWAVIPERSVSSAPIDRAVDGLRRRSIPLWAVLVLGLAVLWTAVFHWWWSPWFPWPLLLVGAALLIVLVRRRGAPVPPVPPTAGTAPGSYGTPSMAAPPGQPYPATEPDPATQAQYLAWVEEREHARGERDRVRRERSARLRPMRVIAWSALTITLAALGVADALTGIALPVYFWVIGGLALLAIVVGAAIRRPVWELTPLLIPAVLGLIAFGGTSVSLHDGSGDRFVTPTAASPLPADNRLAFGRSTFDLRQLPAGTETPVRIRQAAGEVRVIVPPSANVTVHSHLRFGSVQLDGRVVESGVNVTRDVVTGTGAGLKLDVDLEAGTIAVEHQS
jgi:phage shock protein PspC (stress-responsive transcriptional regulator)